MPTPQLLFPLQWNTAGAFQTVEQDSQADMESRVDATVRTPQGWLDEPDDEFGLPPLDFTVDDPAAVIFATIERCQPDIPAEVVEARIEQLTAVAVSVSVKAPANG